MRMRSVASRERESMGKCVPKAQRTLLCFSSPDSIDRFDKKLWPSQKKNVAIKNMRNSCCRLFFAPTPPLLHLCRTLLLAPVCTVLAQLLYFIEIDFLGCECICASILLLLYGMLYIHISLAQSPHCFLNSLATFSSCSSSPFSFRRLSSLSSFLFFLRVVMAK